MTTDAIVDVGDDWQPTDEGETLFEHGRTPNPNIKHIPVWLPFKTFGHKRWDNTVTSVCMDGIDEILMFRHCKQYSDSASNANAWNHPPPSELLAPVFRTNQELLSYKQQGVTHRLVSTYITAAAPFDTYAPKIVLIDLDTFEVICYTGANGLNEGVFDANTVEALLPRDIEPRRYFWKLFLFHERKERDRQQRNRVHARFVALEQRALEHEDVRHESETRLGTTLKEMVGTLAESVHAGDDLVEVRMASLGTRMDRTEHQYHALEVAVAEQQEKTHNIQAIELHRVTTTLAEYTREVNTLAECAHETNATLAECAHETNATLAEYSRETHTKMAECTREVKTVTEYTREVSATLAEYAREVKTLGEYTHEVNALAECNRDATREAHRKLAEHSRETNATLVENTREARRKLAEYSRDTNATLVEHASMFAEFTRIASDTAEDVGARLAAQATSTGILQDTTQDTAHTLTLLQDEMGMLESAIRLQTHVAASATANATATSAAADDAHAAQLDEMAASVAKLNRAVVLIYEAIWWMCCIGVGVGALTFGLIGWCRM
jgi:hypothetical protein